MSKLRALILCSSLARSFLYAGAFYASSALACSSLAANDPPEPSPAAAQYSQDKISDSASLPATVQLNDKLDKLFDKLRNSASVQEAEPVARAIENIWQQDGGAAAGLLSERAMRFAARGKFDEAIVLMDQVVLLQPHFAEGWQRRARLHLQKSRNQRAMLDIREALRFEPRHYNAWVALGRMLEDADDSYHALAAYRRALGIHPYLADVRQRTEKLAAAVRGLSL
jgi:tetratricopeptide (TPR) repeat protein